MSFPALGLYKTTAGNIRYPIAITNGGSGYAGSNLNGGFTGGTGSGLTFIYQTAAGAVTSPYIHNGGTFTVAPTPTFPNGGGSGATGTANNLTNVTIDGLSSDPADNFGDVSVTNDLLTFTTSPDSVVQISIADGVGVGTGGSWYAVTMDGVPLGDTTPVAYGTGLLSSGVFNVMMFSGSHTIGIQNLIYPYIGGTSPNGGGPVATSITPRVLTASLTPFGEITTLAIAATETTVTVPVGAFNPNIVNTSPKVDVQARLTGLPGWITSQTGVAVTAASSTVTGLQPGSSYDLQGLLDSPLGIITYYGWEHAVTLPTLTVGSGTTTVLTAQWGVQANPTTVVLYALRYRQAGTVTWTNVTPTGTRYTATGLLAGTSYEFQLRAHGPDNTYFDAGYTPSVFAATILPNQVGAVPCIVGDYRNGNLYAFNLDEATDNGTFRRWLRSWRAVPKPSQQPQRFSSLRLDMETGDQVPDGTNPQIVLRWSDDGGHTWSEERFQRAGRTGQTARRVTFKRLGSTRRNHGLDRIFEASSTDPFKVALIGAVLKE